MLSRVYCALTSELLRSYLSVDMDMDTLADVLKVGPETGGWRWERLVRTCCTGDTDDGDGLRGESQVGREELRG